jgi:hypothetical protein
MKTIKLLAIVLASTAFLTACNNPGNDGRDQDTMDSDTLMDAPPVDTMGTDTLMNDTL